MKKYEEEKRLEELKRIEEEKKNPAGAKGKAPAPAPAKKPAGKPGEPEKPVVDVPKLEVPKIQEWDAPSGNKYLIERSMDEISQKIMDAPILSLQETNEDGTPKVQETAQVKAPESIPTSS